MTIPTLEKALELFDDYAFSSVNSNAVIQRESSFEDGDDDQPETQQRYEFPPVPRQEQCSESSPSSPCTKKRQRQNKQDNQLESATATPIPNNYCRDNNSSYFATVEKHPFARNNIIDFIMRRIDPPSHHRNNANNGSNDSADDYQIPPIPIKDSNDQSTISTTIPDIDMFMTRMITLKTCQVTQIWEDRSTSNSNKSKHKNQANLASKPLCGWTKARNEIRSRFHNGVVCNNDIGDVNDGPLGDLYNRVLTVEVLQLDGGNDSNVTNNWNMNNNSYQYSNRDCRNDDNHLLIYFYDVYATLLSPVISRGSLISFENIPAICIFPSQHLHDKHYLLCIGGASQMELNGCDIQQGGKVVRFDTLPLKLCCHEARENHDTASSSSRTPRQHQKYNLTISVIALKEDMNSTIKPFCAGGDGHEWMSLSIEDLRDKCIEYRIVAKNRATRGANGLTSHGKYVDLTDNRTTNDDKGITFTIVRSNSSSIMHDDMSLHQFMILKRQRLKDLISSIATASTPESQKYAIDGNKNKRENNSILCHGNVNNKDTNHTSPPSEIRRRDAVSAALRSPLAMRKQRNNIDYCKLVSFYALLRIISINCLLALNGVLET